MYRFFVEPDQITDGKIRILGSDVNHIVNVLRMRPGEKILVSCQDDWEYTCGITTLSTGLVEANILDIRKAGKELQAKICLFQCLPKGDKMELIIQKAVELGACEIIPVASKRCVVKLDEKRSSSRVSRWNTIAQSAAKQSLRTIVPEVKPVITLKNALDYAKPMDLKLIPYEKVEGMEETRRQMARLEKGQTIAVLIGPEGGFEETEVEMARQAGFAAISLGNRILRTETAGITTLSILMYLLED